MRISQKNVGDIVKIDDPGKVGSEYIVIHKGSPSTSYEKSSCDGVWLMRKNALGPCVYSQVNNDYDESTLYLELAVQFMYKCSASGFIDSVRIPHYKSNAVQVGTGKWHSCFTFEISASELGFTTADNSNIPVIGSVLDYFKNGASKRCCYDNGEAAVWWTRTPVKGTSDKAFCVSEYGALTINSCNAMCGYRPVIIAKNDLIVDCNNYLRAADAYVIDPVITSDITGDLGTLTDGFTCNFSVNDLEWDNPLTVTLKVDDKVIRSFPGVRGQQETYTLGGEEWLKIQNGQHTFKILLTEDGDTVEKSATFTRNCDSMYFTLSEPLQTDELIGVLRLKIVGNIPPDADIKIEACNNANDPEPAWEDVSQRVISGLNHVFKNKESQNGYSINLRITAKRGSSNAGGFIDKIICEYE